MTTTTTQRITKRKAEQVLRQVLKQFDEQPDQPYGPKLVKDYDWLGYGRKNWAIVWEMGPDEWALRACWDVKVDGVFAEPITSWSLGLYTP